MKGGREEGKAKQSASFVPAQDSGAALPHCSSTCEGGRHYHLLVRGEA